MKPRVKLPLLFIRSEDGKAGALYPQHMRSSHSPSMGRIPVALLARTELSERRTLALPLYNTAREKKRVQINLYSSLTHSHKARFFCVRHFFFANAARFFGLNAPLEDAGPTRIGAGRVLLGRW